MILPLDDLISNEDNVYALTCAVIRRALQITITGDEEVEENRGKIVSTAIKQVLSKKVEYRIEE
ncbi:MAG: DNA-directed RNA polymerase subunit omega [Spirochaetales bacterium]|jgi:DNA-directed RNA polymerase subunit omega|nr:DNA-directed RNA polymerase subunit omega [Spirochaetales bacterium]